MLPVQRAGEPYSLLRSEMDRLFDSFLGTSATWPSAGRANSLQSSVGRKHRHPALNVWENQECFYLEAECPGMEIDDLELVIKGTQLTVSGKRRDTQPENAAYHRRERGLGSFTRLISLPTEVDADQVEASLKNGVLTVQLPKAATAKPRKIEVKS